MTTSPAALRPEDRRRVQEPLHALEHLVACFRSEAFAEDLPEPLPLPSPPVPGLPPCHPGGAGLAAR